MTAALAPTVAYSPTKEHILQLNPHASANTHTDMSIVEPNAEEFKLCSTLSDDQLPKMRFDYQYVHQPFGYEWSKAA